MLEDFFTVPAAAQRLRSCVLGAHLDEFCSLLVDLGYRAPTIRHKLWIVTGLLRAFGGLEKGAPFYLNSRLFWTKLGLFGLVFVLEIWPMMTFIRWRRQLGRGQRPDTSRAALFSRLNHLEMALVVVIVFVASSILHMVLKYHRNEPVIERLQRVSRPGLRVYARVDKLPKVQGGLGISIVSTSLGVMSDRQARAQGRGGEVLCVVY